MSSERPCSRIGPWPELKPHQYPGVEVHLHRGGRLLARASARGCEVLEPLVGHLKLDRPDFILLDKLLQEPPLALAILHLLRKGIVVVSFVFIVL